LLGRQWLPAPPQVITARNVTGGGVASVMLDGLKYLIGRHLSKSMPDPTWPAPKA
jgi:hypothetical protein